MSLMNTQYDSIMLDVRGPSGGQLRTGELAGAPRTDPPGALAALFTRLAAEITACQARKVAGCSGGRQRPVGQEARSSTFR